VTIHAFGTTAFALYIKGDGRRRMEDGRKKEVGHQYKQDILFHEMISLSFYE
jgi:hypothetical protein